MTAGRGAGYRSAAELPSDVGPALAGTLLALADSKRILGMRYGEWILGAPTLEAGIACSAMAQDEWGHARILYAMLKDFGMDPAALEHGREAGEYRSCELLDAPAADWPDLLALNLLLDTALSVQVEALARSRFEPVHFKARKLLEEERFHFGHARGWSLRLGSAAAGRRALAGAFAAALGPCPGWFGPGDGPGGVLAAHDITDGTPDQLRDRWTRRIAPVLREAGLDELADSLEAAPLPAWDGWDPLRRRRAPGGPDAETLARIRGDRNRAVLMD
ncbi:MAG: Phenylacetic acid catabolic protein [Gemmatimonadota bacterium]|nr:Phenylacetic acid catabolic protein [Gemmatimonadota bacterium]